MNLFYLSTGAPAAIETILNSLPAGLLVALFAWVVLQLFPKQNSGTRFAVWFLALLAVVAIPMLGGFVPASLNHRVFSIVGATEGAASAIQLPSHWAAYLLAAWIVVGSIAMLRLAAGVVRLHMLRRRCTTVKQNELAPEVKELFNELNLERSLLQRNVTLATSEELRVPAALGIWKPMIVFPSWAWRELSVTEIGIILRHEFAHLRRWDDWTNLLQKALRGVFFFHPAVWFIESRLSVEREMACDDVVVAETDNPTGYASCLVSLLERGLAQRGWTMAQAIVHRAREASLRLARILDKNRPSGGRISKPALGLVGTFAAICVVMLPHSPDLVAFESNQIPGNADPHEAASFVHSAVFGGGRMQVPQSISLESHAAANQRRPRALRSILVDKAGKSAATRQRPAVNESSPDEIAALMSADVAFEASAPSWLKSDVMGAPPGKLRPQVETLVLVQAVPVLTPQAARLLMVDFDNDNPANLQPALWHVQVWRVVVFAPPQANVPVANKI